MKTTTFCPQLFNSVQCFEIKWKMHLHHLDIKLLKQMRHIMLLKWHFKGGTKKLIGCKMNEMILQNKSMLSNAIFVKPQTNLWLSDHLLER